MIANVRPLKLSREGEEFLVIDWSDGRRDRLRWTEIRKACPCATCNEERLAPPDPFRILKPGELAPLKPVAIEPIGFYAYRIVWSDGHDSGLFTLEHLRALGEPHP